MLAKVNDACIGCGLCVSTCPDVFRMCDAGTAAGGYVSSRMAGPAQAALEACPTGAITLED